MDQDCLLSLVSRSSLKFPPWNEGQREAVMRFHLLDRFPSLSLQVCVCVHRRLLLSLRSVDCPAFCDVVSCLLRSILLFLLCLTFHGCAFACFLLDGSAEKGTHHDLLLAVNNDLTLLAVGTDKDLGPRGLVCAADHYEVFSNCQKEKPNKQQSICRIRMSLFFACEDCLT